MKSFFLSMLVFATVVTSVNAQNVGIGESAPATRLDLRGATTGDLLNIKTNAGVSRLYVKEDGNVGIGTTNPSAKLEVNGLIVGGRTSEMWAAQRTSYVNADGTWRTIPGLTTTFTMARAGRVSVIANGMQRTAGTSSSNVCHMGIRFLVDNTGRGDGNHGQRLNVTRGDVKHWDTWTLASTESLTSGSHTIAVQVRESAGNSGCVICGELNNGLQGYTNCDLIITAVYD